MRTIEIERKRRWYGQVRALRLHVDDAFVGKIRAGETLRIEIPDDARQLYGRMDWGRTEPFSLIGIEDGARLVVTAFFTFDLFRNLGIASLPIRISRAG